VKGLRADNAALRSENAALRETLLKELGELRKELKAPKPGAWQAPPSILKAPFPGAQPAPSLRGPQAQPRDQTASCDNASIREKGITLNLGKSAAALKGKPLAAIKELAQKELAKTEATKGVKIVGVSAVVGERLEIQTASKEQAESARANAQWTKALGEGAKVRQATWYPIKLDGVAREEICTKAGNGWQLKEGLEKLISESNSKPGFAVKVMKAHWLSAPSAKLSGSMAVYLESEETVQQVLQAGIFLIGANAVFPAPFIRMEKATRCFRCNQYGHMQGKCKAPQPACGKCAGAHATRDCEGKAPSKCAACGGAHSVRDPRCKAWKEQKGRVGKGQEQGKRTPSSCL
jgi:hypothetical protein